MSRGTGTPEDGRDGQVLERKVEWDKEQGKLKQVGVRKGLHDNTKKQVTTERLKTRPAGEDYITVGTAGRTDSVRASKRTKQGPQY